MKAAIVRGGALLVAATGLACGVTAGGIMLAGRIGLTGIADPAVAETLFTGFLFVPLVLVAVVAARIGRGSALAPGEAPGRNLALGLALGLGGVLATVGDAGLVGTLAPGPDGGAGLLILGWGMLVVLFQAASEEVFFRGWLQPALAARWGAWPALVGASLAFAVAHLAGGERAPLSLLNLFLGGLLFGLLAVRAGGIAAAVGAHGAWNIGEQLFFGLDPNPGVGSFGALTDRDLVGAAIWGGSAEGLNGSIIMTAVLLAILVPLAIVGVGRAAAPRPAPV